MTDILVMAAIAGLSFSLGFLRGKYYALRLKDANIQKLHEIIKKQAETIAQQRTTIASYMRTK